MVRLNGADLKCVKNSRLFSPPAFTVEKAINNLREAHTMKDRIVNLLLLAILFVIVVCCLTNRALVPHKCLTLIYISNKDTV